MTPAMFAAGMVALGTALCVGAVRAWRAVETRPLRPLEAFVARLAVAAVMACGMAPGDVDAGALPGPRGCGRSSRVFRAPCPTRDRGLHRSAYVFAMVGNSIIQGVDQGVPWVTRLSTMITKSGVTHSMNNLGHSSYATEYLSDRPNYSLTYKIPTEVDPLWDASKNNVLVLQEVINDIYYGSSAATAYANVMTYFQTTAKQWDLRVVVMPTPRDNPGTPAGYEAERQAFIALVNADPTFGGWVDAVWRVDQDARLGDAADCTNAYYYYQSGGADTKVHWVDAAGSIAASAIMRILRGLRPDVFPFIPQHAPWPAGYYSAATAGSVLASSGGAATDGQTVATWVHDGALLTGNMTTSAGTPAYETSGFGGQPSIVLGATSYLLSASNPKFGRGTLLFTFKVSTPGIAAWSDFIGSDRVLMYAANDGDAVDLTAYHSHGANSYSYAISSDVTDGNSHVMAYVFTGTASDQVVYLDGAVASGTAATSGSTPGDAEINGVLRVGHPGAAFVGEIGEVFASPVPLNAEEMSEIMTYLCTLRGVTCT